MPDPVRDIQDAKDIKAFVDRFYLRVRADEHLGPIFNRIVGENWDGHLETMYRFWGTILFGTGSYKGNPLAVHLAVNAQVKQEKDGGLERKEFETWLQLFDDTLDKLFRGSQVELAKRAARRMSQHLLSVFSGKGHNTPFDVIP